ncbi:MAG TPA: hypothetical protein PK231_03025 [Acidocella sp.]|nr:hypothetical protein [Acidocella sp.]
MGGTVLTGNPAYASYSTEPFTDQERSDVRRFMGYPVYGSGNNGAQFFGYRFFVAYGTMEYRMTNLSPAEYQEIRGIVAQCYTLESAIYGMSGTLNVDTAAVFKRNANEIRDRTRLYAYWRMELCRVMGMPAGPGLKPPGTVEIVV